MVWFVGLHERISKNQHSSTRRVKQLNSAPHVEKIKPHFCKVTSYKRGAGGEGGDDLDLFCSRGTWTCSHWVDHDVLCRPKASRAKCESISLTDEDWTKLGYETEQWTQTQQLIYKRTAQKEWGCWNGPKSRRHLTGCVGTLKELKRINELKQHW